MATLIRDKYEAHKAEVNERFDQLKANEEELNRIFAEIYNMVGEVPIEVEDKYVSVTRIFDVATEVPESFKGNRYVRTRQDEVRSLVSYAVGCMFGRYSLDVDGLVLANQGDSIKEYLAQVPNPTYMPDEDGILPITDDEFFPDDIVDKFVQFVSTAYGEETLEENLHYISDALYGDVVARAKAEGKRPSKDITGTPKEVIRHYFLKDFFADHCQTYNKRPIYWLIDSGKKNAFKALIYTHRYTPDLLARVRTDYVHVQQDRYRGQIERLREEESTTSGAAHARITRELKTLSDQVAELQTFEEKLHHLADQMIPLDLDDGVKVNYAKLQDVLAKIK
ncbi:MAG TPA: hypothetical protein IAD17_01465 [Candidatus Coprovicinus avistercoris]|uniref:Uncharacterized protein n=1 Tax=Candidatus Coprovicinus avistercoris TaxID=2840754 RepID=A0A9D1HVM8_9ACTN|nr:hypothetical protein [Candidatus Coprovicinus avistercoris]